MLIDQILKTVSDGNAHLFFSEWNFWIPYNVINTDEDHLRLSYRFMQFRISNVNEVVLGMFSRSAAQKVKLYTFSLGIKCISRGYLHSWQTVLLNNRVDIRNSGVLKDIQIVLARDNFDVWSWQNKGPFPCQRTMLYGINYRSGNY